MASIAPKPDLLQRGLRGCAKNGASVGAPADANTPAPTLGLASEAQSIVRQGMLDVSNHERGTAYSSLPPDAYYPKTQRGRVRNRLALLSARMLPSHTAQGEATKT